MWKDLLEMQGGVCRVCFKGEPTQVDHFHAPGVDSDCPQDASLVRGAVCHRCNAAIGRYEMDRYGLLNDPRLMGMVMVYLGRARPFV